LIWLCELKTNSSLPRKRFAVSDPEKLGKSQVQKYQTEGGQEMKKWVICLCTVLFLGVGAFGASAAMISLFDWGFNENGTIYTPVDTLPANFSTAGFDFSTGLGSITVTHSGAGSYSLVAFFDQEIDETINTFFNEYGTATGAPVASQSWEIDEPGYVFGDIYSNFLAGALDNSNGVPQANPDDVSMAMGWNFFLENPGDVATMQFVVSTTAPAGGFYLAQTDPDSGVDLYFSSTLNIETVPIPIPAAALLLGSGLMGLVGMRRIRK
jgi:hypothetical protein